MNDIQQAGDAVVIIGSGAGGGTPAYELTKRGVPIVVLEAGPHLHNEDNVNFDDHPNDVAMRNHGYRQAERVCEAVGSIGSRRGKPDPHDRRPHDRRPRHPPGRVHRRPAESRRNLNLSHPTACSTQKKEFYHDRQCDHLAL